MSVSYPPVLSLGKSTEEQALWYAIGSTVIVDVIDVNFPVGTHVWSSDNDYSNTQYRGTVLVSGSSQITVRLPAKNTSSNPCRVWKATAQWTPEWDIQQPRTWKDLGIENFRTGDATIHRTATLDSLEHVRLAWQAKKTTDLNDWWTFVESTIDGGVDQFTASFYDFRKAAWRVCTVTLMDAALQCAELQIGLAPVAIEMAIQSEDTYL